MNEYEKIIRKAGFAANINTLNDAISEAIQEQSGKKLLACLKCMQLLKMYYTPSVLQPTLEPKLSDMIAILTVELAWIDGEPS